MEFKRELINAVELFLLLSLLFWSFTWNSSVYLDFSRPNFPTDGIRKSPRDVSKSDVESDVTVVRNRHSFRIQSFSQVGYESGKGIESGPSEAIFIPPFNEWKEKEMTKYEKSSPKDVGPHHPKNGKNLVRRKLNYASSKCGAKVLASNREARYRVAVLSEKPDEYMLNPCRAEKWFIVELCNTVEATQFELANYELYSSSPREFSVFWSEVYPTQEWQLLGNFEAKDQRLMQTFDLNVKNLGKFIKVVIYNHHGKEHYCPLSIIRVLGYSMVQEFEKMDPALEENSDTATQRNSAFNPEPPPIAVPRGQDVNVSFSTKTRTPLFRHCADGPEGALECANRPACRFLAEVVLGSGTDRRDVPLCSGRDPRSVISGQRQQSQSVPSDVHGQEELPKRRKGVQNFTRPLRSPESWMYWKENRENTSQESPVESAELIHTDSVLFKLTARMKASEKDLNLINKYLQQLSQSYRQQMADMKATFDRTLKAITAQSDKTRVIDRKQDESLKILEKKTKELSLKVDFLISSQKDLLRRVVELHGFFLILEFIIMSTLFTIILNVFRRKKGSLMTDRLKINYFGAVYK